MKSLVLIIILVGATFVWYGFEGESVKSTNASESSSNIPPTNFTGAKLSGVSLDGVILCNTTMSDGTINKSSCEN